jgi:hypothetical protein
MTSQYSKRPGGFGDCDPGRLPTAGTSTSRRSATNPVPDPDAANRSTCAGSVAWKAGRRKEIPISPAARHISLAASSLPAMGKTEGLDT